MSNKPNQPATAPDPTPTRSAGMDAFDPQGKRSEPAASTAPASPRAEPGPSSAASSPAPDTATATPSRRAKVKPKRFSLGDEITLNSVEISKTLFDEIVDDIDRAFSGWSLHDLRENIHLKKVEADIERRFQRALRFLEMLRPGEEG